MNCISIIFCINKKMSNDLIGYSSSEKYDESKHTLKEIDTNRILKNSRPENYTYILAKFDYAPTSQEEIISVSKNKIDPLFINTSERTTKNHIYQENSNKFQCISLVLKNKKTDEVNQVGNYETSPLINSTYWTMPRNQYITFFNLRQKN